MIASTDPSKALPAYAEAGAAIYDRAGLLDECLKILELTLLGEDDLHRRLQWLTLCERLDLPEKVLEWLSNVKPDQQGRPQDLMYLAGLMDRTFGDTRILPLAYRALRAAYEDPRMHLSYTVGLFLMGRLGQGDILTPDRVAPDTAVVLNEKGGTRRLTRIIETEPNPRIERDEIAPDNSLAQRLVGLRVGDEVVLQTLTPEPTRYVVSAIQGKYLHAHFRSLENFQSMFPESRAFGSITIDESKGDEKFKPLFDAVKQRGEYARQIKGYYRSGRMPLAIAAKRGGSSGPEFWDFVAGDPEIQFNVVLGRPEDYVAADRVLREQPIRFVIIDHPLWVGQTADRRDRARRLR